MCGSRNAETAELAASIPSASATIRTRRLPMITPSATAPTSAACSGEPIPNPTATGTSASRFTVAISADSSAGSSARSPVVPTSETT